MKVKHRTQVIMTWIQIAHCEPLFKPSVVGAGDMVADAGFLCDAVVKSRNIRVDCGFRAQRVRVT